MLLSSAGWSDDEDEEKEELITSEIEKFRQKQVRHCTVGSWGQAGVRNTETWSIVSMYLLLIAPCFCVYIGNMPGPLVSCIVTPANAGSRLDIPFCL